MQNERKVRKRRAYVYLDMLAPIWLGHVCDDGEEREGKPMKSVAEDQPVLIQRVDQDGRTSRGT